jgi:hypothetical protein
VPVDDLQGDGRRREPARFELSGVQLDVGPPDIGERVQGVPGAPAQPQLELGGVGPSRRR